MEYGCGQCKPCLLNRKRLWTGRLMLEYQKHQSAFFVTLTYDKEHLPCDGSVSVQHAQRYLKRLRTAIYPRKLRYYMVGEYGEVSKRPHYHLALFGEMTVQEITSSWGQGHVHVGSLTPQSSAYLVSYVVKHLTKKGDVRLGGLHPEFARMSLKPGIGAGAMEDMGKALMEKGGLDYVVREGDVPGIFRTEGKRWPLGRYLSRKLREEIGMDASTPVSVVERVAGVLQDELCTQQGRDLRESKRVQASRIAEVRESIRRVKKGTGL